MTLRPLFATAWVALLLGCVGQTEISHYTVPKTSAIAPEKTRMLAAMVPHQQRAWFFKLQGEEQAAADVREAFKALVASVTFDEQGRPQWTLPDGWDQRRASGIRYATLTIARAEGELPLEVSVTVLPMEEDNPEYRLVNVNRWRGQLGLEDLAADKLADETTKIDLTAGGSALLVDFVGELQKGGMQPPFAGMAGTGGPGGPGGPGPGAGPAAPPGPPQAILGVIAVRGDKGWFFKWMGDARLATAHEGPFKKFVESVKFQDGSPPLTFATPDGWQPGRAGGIRKAAFEIAQDGLTAEVTVIDLAAGGAAVRPNINRWRRQVGLGEVSEDELKKQTQTIVVDGVQGTYVKIIGAERSGTGEETNGK